MASTRRSPLTVPVVVAAPAINATAPTSNGCPAARVTVATPPAMTSESTVFRPNPSTSAAFSTLTRLPATLARVGAPAMPE